MVIYFLRHFSFSGFIQFNNYYNIFQNSNNILQINFSALNAQTKEALQQDHVLVDLESVVPVSFTKVYSTYKCSRTKFWLYVCSVLHSLLL
jgi:hypothetical protein